MLDPFQALAWFAGVHVPEADVSNLRGRARELRALADDVDAIARGTREAIETALKANDSRNVERFARLWEVELGPRYANMRMTLTELADGCEEYADVVDEHREELKVIGTQLAAMAFTLLFGYLYPAARVAAQAVFKWLVARARLERTIFQKLMQAILTKRIGRFNVGTYAVREGLDALADSVVWAVGKTAVHAASSAATGQDMGNLWTYAGKHFLAEMAYNGGIKGLRDVRKVVPATKFTETMLGTGPMGTFFRRTTSAATLYALVASGGMSDEGTLRSALAHAPRAFLLRR
ncbi:WXG100-like domain-containing protein [Nonomuraea muscovyensis]|uniref:Uncharacterized protein n=1 Tax=Nonomuraea muscovyensis TaxID=1124761 RepID=A0A7X0CC05_9ACTN|nr:hypothetical protein [Nonomuraea muscovyensis]MBB6351346.1 hypothetical protein [Nonomuraea muscovyensis]